MRGRGVSWAASGALNSLTNGYTTPNSRIPDLVVHFTGFFGPRSWHTGGAHVVMGDGAARFLSDGTDQELHRGIHSCNGGEAISEFLIGPSHFAVESAGSQFIPYKSNNHRA